MGSKSPNLKQTRLRPLEFLNLENIMVLPRLTIESSKTYKVIKYKAYTKHICLYKNSLLEKYLNAKFWLSSSKHKFLWCPSFILCHKHTLCWFLEQSRTYQESKLCVLDIYEQCGPELASALQIQDS